MPIIPNALERLIFVTLNQAPAPLLDIFGAVAFRTVLAAVNLGVFDALHDGPATAADLARRIAIDERGAGVLLETLASLGYVSRKDTRYTNTRMTTKWLVRSSPTNVTAGFDFWGAILRELWTNLEASLRSGQPPTNLYAWIEQQPEVSAAFQAWMVAAARIVAGEMTRKVKLPATARRLLDVGGGHAMYSVAFCRRYPQLSATVFDSPMALHAARENIAAMQMSDRISVQEGDFLGEALPSGYDVVLLFNIVHGFSPEQNQALLEQAARALNPGGIVAIAEQVAGKAPGPTSDALAQLLGLGYFHLLGGQIYRFEEIAGWLTRAGFTQVRRINILRAPGNSVILGTKAR
jgi:SAM-dependent methyltransferase